MAEGAPVEAQLPEAFALAREAARRALGQRPFDEQILAGLALAQGKIAEMATGEGKTLAAVAPVFLHALAGRGAHVLTFNDYLARRDAAWMGPVYERLGLSVGFVQERMSVAERQRAYGADVTYLTAKEAGFDHLRDALALEPADRVQRAYHFALVDEADSILIDEARIPLVIAGETGEALAGPERLAALVRELVPGRDFDTDEHAHNIALTEAGAARVEAALGCGSLHALENVSLHAQLRHALHAEHLLKRDVDYIVRGGKVELVDESTGRVADRRHWPDGLHAAVEAKEGLRLTSEGRILGQVTLQHFLGLYPRLAGMTATAHTAAEELAGVLRPAHGRRSRPTGRWSAPTSPTSCSPTRRRSARPSWTRSPGSTRRAGRCWSAPPASASPRSWRRRSSRPGSACEVLNARNDEREAAIVAAGRRAGSGHDLDEHGRPRHRHPPRRSRTRHAGPRWRPSAGLYVIGTNRHASLRIDQQLRGRAGRQGDPGGSRFFVSLEDPLIRRYGVEQLVSARHLPARQEAPVESRLLRAEIARAQRIVEDEGFRLRRTLFGYSDIVEQQRRAIQRWRTRVLERTEPQHLLAERAGERHGRLLPLVGQAVLDDVERRLLLLAIDRCWSDHLAELREMREDTVLLAFAGRFPLAEFHKQAGDSFQALQDRIEDEVVRDFERIEITPEGVDWEREGLRGPSATWTYLVGENPFGASGLLSPAGRTGMVALALGAPWLVLLHGLGVFWERRRRRASD